MSTTKKFVGTSENEVVEIKNSTPFNYFNGKGGDDIYVISPRLTKDITIADNSGNNIINLPNGITIAKTVFYVDQVDYTLSTGAVVSVLGGSNMGNIKFVFGDLDLDQDLSTDAGKAALTANAVVNTFTESAKKFGVDVSTLTADSAPVETTKNVALNVTVVTAADGIKTAAAAMVDVLDTAAPVLKTAVVAEDGKSVALTYDDASLYTAKTADASAFSVTVDGTKFAAATAVVKDGTVTLTLDNAIATGQKVTFDYTAPSSEAKPTTTDAAIQDFVGNNSLSLVAKAVTNSSTVPADTKIPEYQSVAVNEAGNKIVLTYGEALATTTASAYAFKVTVDSKVVTPASVAVDGATVVLTMAKTIIAGADVKIQYTVPTVSTSKTNPAIQDLVGNDAAGVGSTDAPIPVTNNSTIDGTAPTLVAVDGGVILDESGKNVVITYSEELSSKAATVNDFTITVDDIAVTATNLTISGPTVSLALPKTITQGQVVKVTYNAPIADGTATNAAIQDVTGNDASGIAAVAATNKSQISPAKSLIAGVETVTGTDSDDVITGLVATTDTETTLNVTDVINGGAGDNTLNVTLGASFTGFTTGSLKNVQHVNLSSKVVDGSSALDFNVAKATGVTSYNIDATNNTPISLGSVTSIADVNLYNLKKGSLAVSYDTTSTNSPGLAANTSDTQKVTLNNVGATSTTGGIDVSINGVETLSLTSAGSAANKVLLENVAAAKTISVAGTAAITVSSVPTTLTSFDAFAETAAVTATLTNASSSLGTIAGGAGNDTFTIDLAKIAATAAISGGKGDDTLIISSTKGSATSAAFALSNIETLSVKTLSTAGNLTISGDSFDTSLTKLLVAADLGANINLTPKAADFTVTSTDGASTGSTVTIDNTGIATVKYTASSTATTSVDNNLNYTLVSAKNALISIDKYVNATGTIKAYNADNLSVTAINGKLTGASIQAAGATGSATITTGSNASTMSLVAAQLTDLAVVAGGSLTLDTTLSKLSSVKTLSVTQSDGTFTAGAVGVAQKVTLNGASGTIVLGTLGSSSSTVGVDLTATGLSGGLSVATGALEAIKGGSGPVSVNVSGTTGAVTIGAISTSGAATVNAARALGAVKLGTIDANAISVDVTKTTTAPSGTQFGTMTAGQTVDFKGSTILDNTVTIAGSATSESLAATLTGGIGNDQFTVNGGAKQTSITVVASNAGPSDSTNTIAINDIANTTGTVAHAIDATGVVGYKTTITTGNIATAVKASNNGDTIVGGTGNDTVTGGTGNDSISAGAGSDSVTGGAGDDTFVLTTASTGITTINDYGKGTDIIAFSPSNTTAFSGAGKVNVTLVDSATGIALDLSTKLGSAGGVATVTGGTGADTITGGTGADSISGGAGNDSIIGGAGVDTIVAGDGNDIVDAGDGADTITGGSGDDSLTGSSGNDTITGGTGNDTLVGGADDDSFIVDSGTDTITAADWNVGTNLLNISAAATAKITVAAGGLSLNTFGTITNAGTLFVDGSAATASVTVTGSSGVDSITGGSGTDSIDAGSGNDIIDGGAGSDTIVGGSGDDTITGGAGSDVVTGGAGADTFVLKADATEILTIQDWGLGTDVLSGAFTGAGKLALNLASAGVSFSVSNISSALGTSGAATITGGAGNDSITGGAGNDTILGGAGSDSITGSTGDDTLSSVSGLNTIDGGDGNDSITGGSDSDTITGAAGNDTLLGGGGADTISGAAGNDLISAGAGTTTVSGDFTGDTLDGGDGDDTIWGSDGSNSITGGAGNDTIDGGAGSDTITGGGQADSITAGTGDDTIKFGSAAEVAAVATVTGTSGTDTLVITAATTSLVDANLSKVAAIDVLQLTGASTIVLGTNANTATIATVIAGAGATNITNTAASLTTVDLATAHATSLIVNSSSNLTVTNDVLTTSITATGSTGTLSVTAANATGNALAIVAGGGSVSVTGGDATDTITVTGLATAGKTFDATGVAAKFNVTASAGSQTITTGAGSDTITGGAGSDAVTGGNGDDVYIFNGIADIAAGDTITESSGAGTGTLDTISVIADTDFSTVTALGLTNVEQLLIASGTTAIFIGAQLTASSLIIGATSSTPAHLIVTATTNTTTDLSSLAFTAPTVGTAQNAFDTGVDTVVINGAGGSNTINGTTLADTINGTGTGIDTIDGKAGNDTIIGGAGSDVITGGAGVDSLTGGTESDTFVTTVGAAYTTATADRITDFAVGASGDVIQISIADSTAIANLGILAMGDGSTAITGAISLDTVTKGTPITLGATKEGLIVTGTYADATALKADLGSTGTTAVTWGTGTMATTNGFLVVWNDGANTHVSAVSDAGSDAAWTVADLAVTDIVVLTGVLTAFNTANLTAVA